MKVTSRRFIDSRLCDRAHLDAEFHLEYQAFGICSDIVIIFIKVE